MKKISVRRLLLGGIALVLIALLVPPLLNVSRYRADVAAAIGRALGRGVSVGEVSLRVFPQPGFALSNLVVEEDPSFGAEPVLLAGDVTAALRLSSLWRGRLEIASLRLNYPSLNLVRRPDGRWNLESLLERATHTDAAPTGNTKPEARPRFPYIEAEDGRVNLKIGQEKKSYALSEADFALWLASEREWRVRLAARPVRTDSTVNDTGTIRISGSFGTAERLADTPLVLEIALERAQLGQFTKLAYGRDMGWRGALDATAALKGTPAELDVRLEAAVDDFHHFDIYGGEGFGLSTKCSGQISATGQSVEKFLCESRVADGRITVQGSSRWSGESPEYQVNVAARNVPAEKLLALGRRIEKDLPADISLEGDVDTSITVHRDHQRAREWAGDGSTSRLLLRSSLLQEPLELGELKFQLTESAKDAKSQTKRSRSRVGLDPRVPAVPGAQPLLAVRTFPVRLGGTAAATSQAWFSRTGYRVLVNGDSDAATVVRLTRALGLSGPGADVRGFARLNFEMVGDWNQNVPPDITGSAQFRSVVTQVEGFSAPLAVRSGTLTVSPAAVTLQATNFEFSGLAGSYTGWFRRPRRCKLVEAMGEAVTEPTATSPGASYKTGSCLLEFRLEADQIANADLYRLLSYRQPKRRWYQVLASDPSRVSPLALVRASGKVAAKNLRWNDVAGSLFSADVELNQGVLVLKRIQAEMHKGKLRGELQADFREPAPAYTWKAELRRFSMESMAGAGSILEGSATVRGTGTAKGWTDSALLETASGSVQLEWRDGLIRSPGFSPSEQALDVRNFAGDFDLQAGTLHCTRCSLESTEDRYEVSGTVSLASDLNLKLLRHQTESTALFAPVGAAVAGYEITGPIQAPLISVLGDGTPVAPIASSKPPAGQQPADTSPDGRRVSAKSGE